MSLSGADTLCDVAPSRFERFDRDEYFTIDAAWIIPALCRASRSKARSSSPALVADTWFMNYARSGSRFTPPISTATPIHSHPT
jgi:hypothetical protein